MTKRVLIFDNYDSFTQNLYNLLKSTRPGYEYYILRNKDKKVLSIDFDVLIISPGPMRPKDTGLLNQLFIEKIIPQTIPVLGVCLGMQFIAELYGEKIIESKDALHGKAVTISHTNADIFLNVKNPFSGARYNSLEVKNSRNIHEIEILATEKNTNSIMALKHKIYPFAGVQFHPESFLTDQGSEITNNFFNLYVENKSK